METIGNSLILPDLCSPGKYIVGNDSIESCTDRTKCVDATTDALEELVENSALQESFNSDRMDQFCPPSTECALITNTDIAGFLDEGLKGDFDCFEKADLTSIQRPEKKELLGTSFDKSTDVVKAMDEGLHLENPSLSSENLLNSPEDFNAIYNKLNKMQETVTNCRDEAEKESNSVIAGDRPSTSLLKEVNCQNVAAQYAVLENSIFAPSEPGPSGLNWKTAQQKDPYSAEESNDSVEIIERPKKQPELIILSDDPTSSEDDEIVYVKRVRSSNMKQEPMIAGKGKGSKNKSKVKKKDNIKEKLETKKSEIFDLKPDPDGGRTTPSDTKDLTCAICLSEYENRAFLDDCFHSFCFACILQWAEVVKQCPLCKTAFKSLIHSVTKDLDYQQHYMEDNGEIPATSLPRSFVEQVYSDMLGNRHRFLYRSTMTTERRSQLDRENEKNLEEQRKRLLKRTKSYMSARNREKGSIERRKMVYRLGMTIKEIKTHGTPRERDISTEFIKNNPATSHRLVGWLLRDIRILIGDNTEHVHFIMHLILSLITKIHMESEEFYQQLHPFFLSKTKHFIRELVSYAKSPYDIDGYDANVVYDVPTTDTAQAAADSLSPWSFTQGHQEWGDTVSARSGIYSRIPQDMRFPFEKQLHEMPRMPQHDSQITYINPRHIDSDGGEGDDDVSVVCVISGDSNTESKGETDVSNSHVFRRRTLGQGNPILESYEVGTSQSKRKTSRKDGSSRERRQKSEDIEGKNPTYRKYAEANSGNNVFSQSSERTSTTSRSHLHERHNFKGRSHTHVYESSDKKKYSRPKSRSPSRPRLQSRSPVHQTTKESSPHYSLLNSYGKEKPAWNSGSRNKHKGKVRSRSLSMSDSSVDLLPSEKRTVRNKRHEKSIHRYASSKSRKKSSDLYSKIDECTLHPISESPNVEIPPLRCCDTVRDKTKDKPMQWSPFSREDRTDDRRGSRSPYVISICSSSSTKSHSPRKKKHSRSSKTSDYFDDSSDDVDSSVSIDVTDKTAEINHLNHNLNQTLACSKETDQHQTHGCKHRKKKSKHKKHKHKSHKRSFSRKQKTILNTEEGAKEEEGTVVDNHDRLISDKDDCNDSSGRSERELISQIKHLEEEILKRKELLKKFTR